MTASVTWCNPFTSGTCLKDVLHGLTPTGMAQEIVQGVGGAAGKAVASATDSAVEQLAKAIETGIGQVLTSLETYWLNLPSPDLTANPVPRIMQEYLWPWTVSLALIGFLVVAARMALTRKGAPLADLGHGILIMACTTAVGTILPTLLMKAGDVWSAWVLQKSTGGKFDQRFGHLFGILASGPLHDPVGGAVPAAGVVIVVGIVFMIAATIQAVLLVFRMGSVVILAGVLPLAAAGSLNPMTKPGFRKVISWMLALIFYKPCAAMVLATGFLMFGAGK